MALDPNVILAGAPATPPVTPLMSSDQLATAQANRETAQARLDALKQQRQALIDQAAGRAAFSAALQQRVDPSTGVPDVDAAINDIYPQYPTFAQTMKATVDASRQKEATTQKQTNENNGWALDHLISIGRTVQNADQYQTWRQLGLASLKDPDEQKQFANMAPEQVPDEQLPEVMGKLNSGLLTAQQALEAQQKSLDLYASGKGLESYASRMMLAATPQARQQAKQDAVAMGIPKSDRAIVDAVDINDPDFAAKMKAILAQSAKPVDVAEGASLVNPISGQTVAAGAAKPKDEFQTFKDAYAQKVLGQGGTWDALTPAQRLAGGQAYVESKADPAAQRQAIALMAQVNQQQRAQSFTEAQAGRTELTSKVEQPYQTALTSAQTLRDTIAAANGGNVVAGNLQALETAMAAIRAQGLNRINTTELGVAGDAGSMWQRIQGWFGKAAAGQPIPPSVQKDMDEFAGILEKAAYQKYSQGFDLTTKRYGLKDETKLPSPTLTATSTVPDAVTAAAKNVTVPAGKRARIAMPDGSVWFKNSAGEIVKGS